MTKLLHKLNILIVTNRFGSIVISMIILTVLQTIPVAYCHYLGLIEMLVEELDKAAEAESFIQSVTDNPNNTRTLTTKDNGIFTLSTIEKNHGTLAENERRHGEQHLVTIVQTSPMIENAYPLVTSNNTNTINSTTSDSSDSSSDDEVDTMISTQEINTTNFRSLLEGLTVPQQAHVISVELFQRIVDEIKSRDNVDYSDIPRIVYQVLSTSDTLDLWARPSSIKELTADNTDNLAVAMINLNYAIIADQPGANVDILRHMSAQIPLFNFAHLEGHHPLDYINNPVIYRQQLQKVIDIQP